MRNGQNSIALSEVLKLIDSSVPVAHLEEVNLAGVYGFGRGLFQRGTIRPAETSYRYFNKLNTNDFVISIPKAWEGALARVTPEFQGWYLSPVFPTFRADRERLDPKYLEWFCKRKTTWDELQRKSRGIGARRESVSPDQFLSLSIPLPPLNEQWRIVARVEELAVKVEEARQVSNEARIEASALVPAILSRGYDMAVAIAGGTQPLKELCELITDGTHVTPMYVPDGIPFLSVKDITSGEIRFNDARFITRAEHELLTKRCKPERGDVLLTKVGTTGFAKAVDVDREFSIFVSLALLKLKRTQVLPRFIEHMLNSSRLREHSAKGTRGVGNKNLVLKFIREFPMPAPTIPAQRELVAKLDALLEKACCLSNLQGERARELDALLPSILDKAFKGEF